MQLKLSGINGSLCSPLFCQILSQQYIIKPAYQMRVVRLLSIGKSIFGLALGLLSSDEHIYQIQLISPKGLKERDRTGR